MATPRNDKERLDMARLQIRLANDVTQLKAALVDPKIMKLFTQQNLLSLASYNLQTCTAILQAIKEGSCAFAVDENTKKKLQDIANNAR
jgi:hypothetical protein